MLNKRMMVGLITAGILALSGVACAQDADQGAGDKSLASILSHMPKEIIACQPHDAKHEESDRALLQKAIKRFNVRDVAGLDKLMPDIKTALARAPNKPSLPENCNGKLIIYSSDIMDMLMASGMTADKESGITSVVQVGPLPYAQLYFLAGWLAVEHKDGEAAIDYFEKGLLNDPHSAMLASEYANVLALTGNSDVALEYVNKFIDENAGLEDMDMALMLRRKGYALGELKRYDEAIAAYKESLKLDPENKVALNEIEYNTQQKALHKN